MSDLVKLAQLQKYWEEGQLEALQEVAEDYMQQYPRDSRGYLYGGRVSLALSDYDKAKECFLLVIGFDETNEEAMLALERIDSERVSNPELLGRGPVRGTTRSRRRLYARISKRPPRFFVRRPSKPGT